MIGLGFHREEFLGGYGSFRRRLLRLGHIALAALGSLNVLSGLSPVSVGPGGRTALPGLLLLAGAVADAAGLFSDRVAPALSPFLFYPGRPVGRSGWANLIRWSAMKIDFLAMSGVRAHDKKLLELGLTLPGFVERSRIIASLPEPWAALSRRLHA